MEGTTGAEDGAARGGLIEGGDAVRRGNGTPRADKNFPAGVELERRWPLLVGGGFFAMRGERRCAVRKSVGRCTTDGFAFASTSRVTTWVRLDWSTQLGCQKVGSLCYLFLLDAIANLSRFPKKKSTPLIRTLSIAFVPSRIYKFSCVFSKQFIFLTTC